MPKPPPDDAKLRSLREQSAINPRSKAVTDDLFAASEFFDPRDLVQVKYEMLRRVREDGSTVSQAAKSFGFSRPSFYEAQAAYETAGLPGLLPKRPGPKRAHKLSDAVVDRLEAALAADDTLISKELAALLFDELGVRVHPRSIERALARRGKAGGRPSP
jgi:transposase